MGKKLFFTLIVLAVISVLTGKMSPDQELQAAQPATEPEVTDDPLYDPLIRNFDTFIQQGMAAGQIPGVAVAIVRENDIIFLQGFGFRKTGAYAPVDIHTVFRLASVSKGFAPVLAARLIDEGLLSFDDRIIEYVPDFRLKNSSNTNELTLRHVLSHATGLPRHAYSNLINAGYSYPEIRNRLRDVKIFHPVGTYYNYQNVAYCLSGDVIESVTKKKYANLLKEQLFIPLGMTDASATYQDIMAAKNVALPHRNYRSGLRAVDIVPNWYEVGPAAGVNASIADMARWLQFLLGNRPDVLPDSLLNEVFKPQVAIPLADKVLSNWRGLAKKAHYALGWRTLETTRGDRIVFHGGYVNRYRSEVMLLPDEKIAIAILANAPGDLMSDCLPAFYQMYCDFRDNYQDVIVAVSKRETSRDTLPIPVLPFRYPGTVGSLNDR